MLFKGKHITDKATDFSFRFPQNRVYTTEPKRFAEKFDATVKSFTDKIFENCKQIRVLGNLRDTVLPKLMSGRVKVLSN